VLFVGALLDPDHDPRVDELADEEAGQPGDRQPADRGDGARQCVLVGVVRSPGQPHGRPQHQHRERLHGEADEHRAACGAEAVHLAEHVADDVGQGKDEEAAVGEQRPERHALGGRDVGDEDQSREDGDQCGVVGRAHRRGTSVG
jgi:hypothetical protein